MGWPFGRRRAVDPHAVREAQPTAGIGGGMGAALDFTRMAVNKGCAQLADTAARFAPDSWGMDAPLWGLAQGRRDANDQLIEDRIVRSGVPLTEANRMDPGDFATRTATFRTDGALNPDSGGVTVWRRDNNRRIDAWNARAGQAGDVAPLVDPTNYVAGVPVADAGAGLMFGRRRRR